MGHNGYSSFIYMYVVITRALFGLVMIFIRMEQCEESFNKLKECLTSTPILKSPDWNLIFHVYIDALNFATGPILAQSGEKNMDFTISFACQKLNNVNAIAPL